MIVMRPTLAAALLSSSLVLSGCAAFSDDSTGSGAGSGSDKEVQVVASFYPLHYAAQRVAGDRADVVNLSQPGAEPHDLEIPPKETSQIVDADLVVFESGFQPAVDDAIDQNAAGETLDAAEVVDLLPLEEGEEGEGHGNEEHGAEEHAGEEGHDHGELDPHFWQDPVRLAKLGDAVADKLATVDPDHAEEFTANAERLRADLDSLDRAYQQGLADCERDTVVVSHDAFGYLSKYGLHMEPIAGLSPDAEPTPADLARLQDLIGAEGITTVFSERLVSPRLSRTLADDMGITTAVLDPIEGLSDQTADEDYVSLMEHNLASLKKANACP
jgi:zinc transport system substrate-binding protein